MLVRLVANLKRYNLLTRGPLNSVSPDIHTPFLYRRRHQRRGCDKMTDIVSCQALQIILISHRLLPVGSSAYSMTTTTNWGPKIAAHVHGNVNVNMNMNQADYLHMRHASFMIVLERLQTAPRRQNMAVLAVPQGCQDPPTDFAAGLHSPVSVPQP